MASTSSDNHNASDITLTISFRGATYPLTISPSAAVSTLHTAIEDLTDVPVSLQKVLFKGKKLIWTPPPETESDNEEKKVGEAGLKDGMKVQVLGSTLKEVEGMKKEEGEFLRRERIMRERALKAPVKVRNTGSSSSSSSTLLHRFHAIQPLPHLPNPSSALALLNKLAADPAIVHIMHKHEFTVGLLTELAPHEHPELLGLNENAGQAIKLRLRTDKYDGFRLYSEVRRVLCHELTHNVWGDHDDNFKELNSKLNKEVAEYERSVSSGTHHLSGRSPSDMYQPSTELEAEARAYVLGGSAAASSSAETQEERRRKMLDATMNRLRREEEEIEHSCGTTNRGR